VQGVLLFFVPESPRWLYSVGREAEGHAILAKYHANGDMEDELVLLQIAEIKAALDVAAQAKQVSYLDFFRTKANRKRLFLAVYVGTFVQWAGNGLISSTWSTSSPRSGSATPYSRTASTAVLPCKSLPETSPHWVRRAEPVTPPLPAGPSCLPSSRPWAPSASVAASSGCGRSGACSSRTSS